MSALERRYRWLLRAYPRWYLADRGEEMLGTLLDSSSEGRMWPSARDARALVTGGLRARSGLGQRQPVHVNVRLAVLLAITMQLLLLGAAALLGTAGWLWGLIYPADYSHLSPGTGFLLAYGLLGAAAAVAAWLGRRVIAGVAVVCAIAALWAGRAGWALPMILITTAVLGGLALLTRSGQRLPKSWLWLVGGQFLYVLLFRLIPYHGDGHLAVAAFYYSLYAAAALWMLIDARPALAMGLSLTYAVLTDGLGMSVSYAKTLEGWTTEALLAGGVLLAILAIWRVRRQAVL